MILYFLLEFQYLGQCIDRMFCGLLYTDQEVFDPVQQIVFHPNVIEIVVIKVFPFIKIRRDVEQRLMQNAFFHQKQCDEQPAHTSVSIQEWMDGLKLIVRDGNPY